MGRASSAGAGAHRRHFARQRRRRHAAVAARRSARAKPASSPRGLLAYLVRLCAFGKNAARGLPRAAPGRGPHRRRRHAQLHGRRRHRDRAARSGDQGAPRLVRFQRRGEAGRRVGRRADVPDESGALGQSLRRTPRRSRCFAPSRKSPRAQSKPEIARVTQPP